MGNMPSGHAGGCPCCAEELAPGRVPHTTFGKKQHPGSLPEEPFRKEFTQCQNCMNSRGSGITLLRCSGCRIDVYCSKKCQKEAWPMHKEKCKLNRRCLDVGDDLAAENALLRAFTGKHRPVIADSAIRALDIQKEPSRAKTHFLLIRLRKRSGRLRTETAYFVMDAEVVPYAAVPEPKRTEMQQQLKLAFENQKRAVPDTVGTVFAMLVCVDPITNVGVSNVAPISFQPDVETLEQIIPGEWKQTLVMMLNEGVVL